MGVRFALRFGLVVTLSWVVLLLVAQGLGPLLPDAGQLGYEAPAAYYMLDVARGIQHPIIQEASSQHSWSTDGSRLAFARPLRANLDELMLLDLYGAASPISPVSINQPPVWSPDNQALAFMNANDLVLVETANQPAEPTRVTHLSPINMTLKWDQNGRLRFATTDKREVQLYEAVPDAPEPRLVRSWPVNFLQMRPPVFAPDGSRFIVAAIQPNALNLELYLFDAESDAVENLSNRPLFNDSGVVWSPDGTAIVYRSYSDAGQYLMLDSVDNQTESILLHVPDGRIEDVTWSPDQTSLSFFLSRAGQQTLCILTIASENLHCPIADAETMHWRPRS